MLHTQEQFDPYMENTYIDYLGNFCTLVDVQGILYKMKIEGFIKNNYNEVYTYMLPVMHFKLYSN